MSLVNWRKVQQAIQADNTKPTLDSLLDHYEAQYKPYKDRQVIRCLFHEDRTPSMSIAREAGLWHCFSCGRAGDTWDLIMLKEEVDYRGARAFATAQRLAEGGTGGGDTELSRSAYGFASSRRLATSKRDRKNRGGFRPSWRRD